MSTVFMKRCGGIRGSEKRTACRNNRKETNTGSVEVQWVQIYEIRLKAEFEIDK